jgi:hypothetical protein
MQISEEIKGIMATDITGLFMEYYPAEKIRAKISNIGRRDRVYNEETTLMTMIISSIQQDKSLQHSVNIYKEIHENNIDKILLVIEEKTKKEREEDSKKSPKAGRPKEYKTKVAKSKLQPISESTSAFTQARNRLDIEVVKYAYEESSNFEGIKIANKWKGMPVAITDGTYLQTQDTEELRSLYDIKSESENFKSGYPQCLLQLIIEQGSGAIKQFEIGSRHISELELISKLLAKTDKGTLLLADDLYNTYAIFCLIKQHGLEIIVPGKRDRNYKVIKTLGVGDEIVEIKKTKRPEWLSKDIKLPQSILMRRLTFENPNEPGKLSVIYTTLLDKSISKTDIVLKYFTRWGIEITIREIKTLMDINVLRGKTQSIILKELLTAFIAYNLIRKIIAKTSEKENFFPNENIIQKYFETSKTVLMDKKGRIYTRWSPGRYGSLTEKNN